MSLARMCHPALFEELEEFRPVESIFRSLLRNEAQAGITMSETDEALTVEVPVPGCHEEKIHVSFEKGSLIVKAEEQEEKKDVRYLVRSSRNYAFQIPIPSRIDENASPEATYKHGILSVKFPKSRAARPMKINVQSK